MTTTTTTSLPPKPRNPRHLRGEKLEKFLAVLGTKILVLEEEEAVLKQDCCLYHSVAHRYVPLLQCSRA